MSQFVTVSTLPGAIILSIPVDEPGFRTTVALELNLEEAETVIASLKGAVAGARAELDSCT